MQRNAAPGSSLPPPREPVGPRDYDGPRTSDLGVDPQSARKPFCNAQKVLIAVADVLKDRSGYTMGRKEASPSLPYWLP